MLYDRDGEPRLVVPALVALLLTIAIGIGLTYALRRPPTDLERADALMANGRFAAAEESYVRIVREKPSVEAAIALVNNHAAARAFNALMEKKREANPTEPVRTEKMLTDAEIDGIVSAISDPEALLAATFQRALVTTGDVPDETGAAVIIAADRAPPMPFANRLLAELARKNGNTDEAAKRYEREGLSFPERKSDVDRALLLWAGSGDWNRVRERLADPRVRAASSGDIQYELAVHDHDWLGVAKAAVLGWRSHREPWALVTAGIAALAWAFFCARLGKLGERPFRRVPFYVSAFVLGVLSVVPTLVLAEIEREKIHLVESGEPTRDILFFVFGVGLREEASKILLFLPLLPFIRRFGDKLDVLVCGAMVGLGFAAEENLGYLANGNLQVGLARFLTANFFHMAMTGTIALALDELFDDREENAMRFSKTALTVIAMHGAYDFLLSHEEMGGAFFAMFVFIILTRIFLQAVDRARGRADRGISLLHTFVLSMSVVTGVTGVRAITAVGPFHAVQVMAGGLLGVAIIIIVFVRTLRAM
jgi:RsiW-degrading membrane proteinase PrsW (M82 family)